MVTDVSDHFGIFSILQNVNTINTTKSNTKQSRSFNDENMKIFKKSLDTTDFQEIHNTDCPDKAYNEFINIYMDTFEIAFPLKEINTPTKFRKAISLDNKRPNNIICYQIETVIP